MGQMIHRDIASSGGAMLAGPAPAGRCRGLAPAICGAIVGSDVRADGQQRVVVVGHDCVRIDRRLAGIAMRVAVPTRAYRGVALSLEPEATGALRYQISLLHHDADLCVTLASAGDDVEILADWRSWSRFLRLPALVERRPGLLEAADPMLGGLPVGKGDTRRRPTRGRARRRPRFFKRRKPGNLALAAVQHAGEREIIART